MPTTTSVEARVRNALYDLLDTNPMACRAVLGLCALEFTTSVPTAAVTLGERPVLKVNPDFIAEHAPDDEDVRFVLMHEFMHVVLRHTRKFPHMTPALNFALDCIVNPLVIRLLKGEGTAFLRRYYWAGRGYARVLAPPLPQTPLAYDPYAPRRRMSSEESIFRRLRDAVWEPLYPPALEDIVHLLPTEDIDRIPLLGNHAEEEVVLDATADAWVHRIEGEVLPTYSRYGSAPVPLTTPRAPYPELVRWKGAVRRMLSSILVAQGGKRGTARNPQNGYVLPVLSTSDRRAAVLHGRSPFLPFSEHFTVPSTPGSVVVYLDVSGSMLPMLPHLVTLLYEFRDWIRLPLWTFDCTVLPARLSDAHLFTRGGGGTDIEEVFYHIREQRFERALVISDGYIDTFVTPPCPVHALLTPGSDPEAYENIDFPYLILPPFPKAT